MNHYRNYHKLYIYYVNNMSGIHFVCPTRQVPPQFLFLSLQMKQFKSDWLQIQERLKTDNAIYAILLLNATLHPNVI